MIWIESWRADPRVRRVADRHYNRQKIGAKQFVPPGRCLVLRTVDDGAAWITSWPLAEYVKHAWPGAWINSLFRNERRDLYLSSDLIRQAVSATLARFGEAPPIGMVSFVDDAEVRRKRDPGRCFLRAGFKHVGFTKDRLWAFQLLPSEMPAPAAADREQLDLVRAAH